MPLALPTRCTITTAALLASSLFFGAVSAQAQTPPAAPQETPPPQKPQAVLAAPEVPASGLRIHRVRLALTVAEGEDVAQRLVDTARSLGGSVKTCSSDLCFLVIPLERLEDAVHRISLLGRADRPTVLVEDVTERYVDLGSRLTAIDHAIEQIRLTEKRPGSVQAKLQLQSEQNRLQVEALRLQQEARRLLAEARVVDLAVAVDHPLRARGESIAFRLPFPWLEKIGYDHLINPPHVWEGSRAAMDGRTILAVGAPTSRARYDVSANTSVGFGIRVGECFKRSVIGWTLGVDLQLGAGWSSGFLYSLGLLWGPSLYFGNRTILSVQSGISTSAIKGGALAGAAEIPIELSLTTDLGRYMRVNLFSRPQWVFASKSRKDGALHTPFGDEYSNGGWVALGKRGSDRTSQGLMLGFTWQQVLETNVYTGMIGYHGSFFEKNN